MLTLRRRDPLLRYWDTAPEFRDAQRLFDNFLTEMNERRPWFQEETTPWTPPVDVIENEEEFEFFVELPGMKLEDLKLTLEGDFLVVEGEREWKNDEEKERFHRRERYFGSFRREMRLPPKVDPDRIEAKFHDGVLEIHLPVLEIAKPRMLEVTAA